MKKTYDVRFLAVHFVFDTLLTYVAVVVAVVFFDKLKPIIPQFDPVSFAS